MPLPLMSRIQEYAVAAGDLADLLGVYGGLDSGRIVVLGGAGAGKSSAAILLLLDALAHRKSLADRDERARTPVPVLLTVHGWDPSRQKLVDWLASRLEEEYPVLRATPAGRVASALVRTGRIALMLDGLDELPELLRPVALHVLATQATFRLVLLTRSQELVTAAAGAHLTGALALELQPVAPDQAADYLARCQVHPAPAGWQGLIEQLRTRPDDVLTRALDTPLMLTLVRDTYPAGTPLDDLVAPGRYRTRDEVEDHLLDRVLPAAYAPRPGQPPPRYTEEQARRWLGFIARRMADEPTRDLAWWRIYRWRPARYRVMATALAFGFAWALTGAWVVGIGGWLLGYPGFAIAVDGGLIGLVIGVVFGAVVEATASRRPAQWGRIRWAALRSVTNIVTGVVVAVAAIGFNVLLHNVTHGLIPALALGFVFWLGGGLRAGISHPTVDPLSAIEPVTCWRLDLRLSLIGDAAFLSMLCLAGGFVVGYSLGLVTALMSSLVAGSAGLLFGLLFAGFGADAWPAMVTSAQLALAGTGPFRMLRFLEDARSRDILRVAGPVYQFRHARLQDRLAAAQTAAQSQPTTTG